MEVVVVIRGKLDVDDEQGLTVRQGDRTNLFDLLRDHGIGVEITIYPAEE